MQESLSFWNSDDPLLIPRASVCDLDYMSMWFGLRALLRFGEESQTKPGLFTAPLEVGVGKNSETIKSEEPPKLICFNYP